MKRTFCLSYLAVGFYFAAFLHGQVGTSPPSFEISGRPARDLALVYDLSQLDLRKISSTDGIWIVAQIRVDPGAGIPMGRMMPETGPGSHLVVTVSYSGMATLLATIRGPFEQKEFKFKWDNPSGRGGGTSAKSIELTVPQHLHDGVFAIQWDPAATGEKQFKSIFELPDAKWAQHLKDAVEYFDQQQAMFKSDSARETQDELIELSQNSNPVLAITGFRMLSSIATIDKPIRDRAIQKSPPFVQAIMIQAALAKVTSKTIDDTSAEVIASLTAVGTIEAAEGIVSGITAFSKPSAATKKAGGVIVNHILSHLSAFKGANESRDAVKRLGEIYRINSR